MFVEIDDSIDSDLDEGVDAAVGFMDELFTAHRLGNLILVLKRKQAVRYRELLQLSGSSRKTAGQISNRLNDYTAAMGSATRRILACSPKVENSYRFEGQSVRVFYRLLLLEHLSCQKFLLGEGIRDVDIIGFLTKEYYSLNSYPSGYVTYRPLIGGGGSCHHVLEAEQVTPCKGFVICDRDAVLSVPPFKANSTAEKVYESAKRLGLMGDRLGLSDVSPFFGFDITWGRTIENMIGPHVLDLYFSANGRMHERRKFAHAFQNFPNLSELEMTIWRDLNLKDGTGSMTLNVEALRKEIGTIPMAVVEKLGPLGELKFPPDTLDWIRENQTGQRWTSHLRVSARRDLASSIYREAIARLALPLLTIAAGDASARRS